MAAISVIIPSYNHAEYVGEAIQSVLDQTFTDFELVVVDDGSTDHTQEILANFRDPRLRSIRQANAGLLAARSAGLRETSAPLVSFLDADDLFLPDKLAVLHEYLKEHSHVGLVAGGVQYIDPAGRILGENVATPASLEVTGLLLQNPIIVSGILLRRPWLERVGGFAASRVYDACGDWDLWLRLRAAGCQFGWMERAVVAYRVHPGQMSGNAGQMRTAALAVLDRFFKQPDLPAQVLSMQDQARAAMLVKSAARAYHAGEFEAGQRDLAEAVELDPDLMNAEFQRLASLLVGWAYAPQSQDPEAYLRTISRHLPRSLHGLRPRLRQATAAAALWSLSEDSSDRRRAGKRRLLRAVWTDPSCLLNRGVIRMLVDAWLPFGG